MTHKKYKKNSNNKKFRVIKALKTVIIYAMMQIMI